MNAVERALLNGISEITKGEVFYLVYKIDKLALPVQAQDAFWEAVGEKFKVENNLLKFREAYKNFSLGYTAGLTHRAEKNKDL